MKSEHKKLAEELNLEDFDVSEEMEQLRKDIALEDEIIHRSYRVSSYDKDEMQRGRQCISQERVRCVELRITGRGGETR